MNERLSIQSPVTLVTVSSVVLAMMLNGVFVSAQLASIVPIVVPDNSNPSVASLNNSGHVAGYLFDTTGNQRAFFWDGTNSIDLGSLGGSVSVVNDLNDQDQTTGYATSVGNAQFRAFLGVGLTLSDLGSLGGSDSAAYAINNAGTVTGYSFVSLSTANFHAFLSRNGGMTSLGTLGGSISAGVDVNEFDQVAGDSNIGGDLESHAFFYGNGLIKDVGTLGGTFSSAADLNNLGNVTGHSTTAGDAELHAFFYENGSIHDVGTLGGSFSTGYAINDDNTVIGDSWLAGDLRIHAFSWRAGVISDLGHLGGHYSSAWAINAVGTIVGVSSNEFGQRKAVIWKDGTLADLNSFLPVNSGWNLTDAYFINDNGQVVGTGFYLGAPSWYRLDIQSAVNQPPVADAGADLVVECGEAALIDGSRSRDPEGDTLSYLWLDGDSPIGTTPLLVLTLPVGIYKLRLQVADSQGYSAEDEVVVSVRDSISPIVVQAPATLTLLTGPACVAETPDVRNHVTATDNCTPVSALVFAQNPAPGALLSPGTHEVSFMVEDQSGNATNGSIILHVYDKTAPELVSIAATPNEIRPANKQMVSVTLSVVALDLCDPAPKCRIVRVESSEPVTTAGDKTSPDWNVLDELSLQVRAEVNSGTVRIYTVVVACADRAGNEAVGQVQISISRGKTSALQTKVARNR